MHLSAIAEAQRPCPRTGARRQAVSEEAKGLPHTES
jgi:hypothetical protein